LATKLFIADQRMLQLMDYCIASKIVDSQKDWCTKIGFNQNNITQIRSAKQGFTDVQKLAAVKMAGANMNWLYGLEPDMIRRNNKTTGLQLIKEGVRMLDKK
jgi:arginine repressor